MQQIRSYYGFIWIRDLDIVIGLVLITTCTARIKSHWLTLCSSAAKETELWLLFITIMTYRYCGIK
jgi:hypothetical protein